MLVISFLLLCLALFLDTVLPPDVLLTPFYAIPIAVVSFRFNWRVVVATAFVCVTAFSLRAAIEELSILNYGIKLISFITVGTLGVDFSIQREKAEAKAEEAQRSKQSLQTFMEMVSHDLRQPLTVIKLYAEILQRHYNSPPDPNVAKLLGAVNHAQLLVSDLKEAASYSGGHFVVRPKRADVLHILAQVVREQQQGQNKHQILLDTKHKRIVGIWDGDRLEQLFTNLISNAVKYSPQGGEVKVTATKDKLSFHLCVADQGIGMTIPQQKQLFAPFMRLHHKSSIKGTGLGLYISKAIVDAHHGKIWVKSKRQVGSEFYVELPLAYSLRRNKR